MVHFVLFSSEATRKSSPQPLATRLALLKAAEDAVTATYSYPRYPDTFLSEVQPHICRYITAESCKTFRKSTIHAVYAALILSDPRTEAPTEADVARKLQIHD